MQLVVFLAGIRSGEPGCGANILDESPTSHLTSVIGLPLHVAMDVDPLTLLDEEQAFVAGAFVDCQSEAAKRPNTLAATTRHWLCVCVCSVRMCSLDTLMSETGLQALAFFKSKACPKKRALFFQGRFPDT